MKRKVISLLMAAMLLCSTLGGCGDADNTAATTNKEESQTTEAENKEAGNGTEDNNVVTESGERLTISVMGIDWGYGPKPNSEMEEYWEDLFHVNFDIEWVNYQDYSQKLNTLIASGSQPDVIQINKTNGSYYYSIFTQAIDAGNFVDMTPYIFGDEGLASANAVMKNWSDSIWEQASYNNGIYILPRCKSESGQNSGIGVRRDLMEKYGYTDEPETMEELKDWLIGLSNAATEGEGQKVYALEFFGDNFMDDRLKAFAIAFTGQTDWMIDENGEFSYIQFNEKYIDFLKWVKDLYDADVLDPEFALGNSDTSKYRAGNSVALLNAWYNFNQSEDLTSNKIYDKNTPDTYEAWELMPVKGPEAYTVSPNYTDIDSCIAISSNCSDEKIRKILEVFNGTEEAIPGYNILLSDGVEGVHYKLLEDGTRDSSDEDMGRKKTEGYVGAWNQIFLKTDADQVTDKFMRPGARRSSDEVINRALAVKAFVYSNLEETGMKNAISNLQSATYNTQWSILTDDVNTMCAQYIMGQIDEAMWKAFVDGLVEASDYKSIQKEFKESAAK